MEKKEKKFKPENLKEFKNLLERYRTITLEEINEVWESTNHDSDDTLKALTGFGYATTCNLCNVIDRNCSKCIWSRGRECKSPYSPFWCVNNSKTYNKIEHFATPEELLLAYRNRAKYMIQFLKRHYNIEVK